VSAKRDGTPQRGEQIVANIAAIFRLIMPPTPANKPYFYRVI
jgi:hypothetical protein